MAAKLQCEICGGKLVGKPGGIFECDSCGTEYSTEWAKAKIQEISGTVKVEGTVEVTGKVQVEGGTVQVDTTGNLENFLKRGFMFCSEKDWESANGYFDKALDIDAECGEAYLGKLMVERKVKTRSDLANQQDLLCNSELYRKAVRFSDDELMKLLHKTEEAIKGNIYQSAMAEMSKNTEDGYIKADTLLAQITDYADVMAQRATCAIKIQEFSNLIEELRKQRKGLFKQAQRFISCYPDATTVGLKADGTILLAGKLNPTGCHRIDDGIALLTGGWIKKADGTKANIYGIVYSESKKIVDYSSSPGKYNLVTLYADGTVQVDGAKGSQCNVSGWKNIIAVAEGDKFTVGVKSDGKVVAVGENLSGQCDVSKWENIVAVAAGYEHTVGLKADGTIVIAGLRIKKDGLSQPTEWRHVVSIAAYKNSTIALRADGTVVTDEILFEEQVSKWTNIFAIAVGADYIVGLKSDGTVIAAGDNSYGQCDVSDWKLFNSIETAVEEQKAAEEQRRLAKKMKEDRKRKYDELSALLRKKNKQIETAKNELENLRGLFTGKRRKELEEQIAADTAEQKQLYEEAQQFQD